MILYLYCMVSQDAHLMGVVLNFKDIDLVKRTECEYGLYIVRLICGLRNMMDLSLLKHLVAQ